MSKQSHTRSSAAPPTLDNQRLVVWGERRKEPDWDTFIAALLAFALREVEAEPTPDEESHGD